MNLTGNLVLGAGVTNFRGGWDKVWAAFTTGWTGFAAFLTVVGVIAVLIALIMIIVAARRGGQGLKQAFGAKSAGLLIIGLVLAAPAVIFPMLLGIADWAVAIGVNLFELATGSKRG
ncbi:hypothetical protein [Glutamicibacter ardleyensis]|uniref:hypothetical protein n=1 Tax=Glutamicibacter ardleyensis TaxID=225894 RepID=UPI003FCF9175